MRSKKSNAFYSRKKLKMYLQNIRYDKPKEKNKAELTQRLEW